MWLKASFGIIKGVASFWKWAFCVLPPLFFQFSITFHYIQFSTQHLELFNQNNSFEATNLAWIEHELHLPHHACHKFKLVVVMTLPMKMLLPPNATLTSSTHTMSHKFIWLTLDLLKGSCLFCLHLILVQVFITSLVNKVIALHIFHYLMRMPIKGFK